MNSRTNWDIQNVFMECACPLDARMSVLYLRTNPLYALRIPISITFPFMQKWQIMKNLHTKCVASSNVRVIYNIALCASLTLCLR